MISKSHLSGHRGALITVLPCGSLQRHIVAFPQCELSAPSCGLERSFTALPAGLIIFFSSHFPSGRVDPLQVAHMYKAFKLLSGPVRSSRYYSQQAVVGTREGASNPTQQLHSPKLVRYPYYVPRNTRGSLPVYSDIRNNGTRVLVLIRNVEGNVEVSSMIDSIELQKLLMGSALTCASISRNSLETSKRHCLKKVHPTRPASKS